MRALDKHVEASTESVGGFDERLSLLEERVSRIERTER
jgi:hypothetical protein